jgi:hypothetical protein
LKQHWNVKSGFLHLQSTDENNEIKWNKSKFNPNTLKPHPFVVAQLQHFVTPNIEELTKISSNNEMNSKFEQV